MFSKNTPLDTADQIKMQADAVLQRLNIPSLVSPIGALYFTGSYALNLMTWNDIDMQIVIQDGSPPPSALLPLISAFIHEKNFIKTQIINFAGDHKPHWPRGLCLSAQVNFQDLGGIWKFDIWILERDDFEKNQALVKQLKAKMSNQSRALILEIKHELMQNTGRVPKMGSHWLYQAILIHGLSDQQSILKFLREKGVTFD